jgi:UDP-glucose 4-epimerase
LNVLVTGANGFVGRHVAKAAAARGCKVVGLGHGAWTRNEWKRFGLEEWRTADVTLETLLAYGGNPAVIIHCAGSGSVSYSMTNPFQDFERTVDTTLAVLEFSRLRDSMPRIVICSSAAVYGRAAAIPTGVREPLIPISTYGVHKKLAEDLCRGYAHHFGVRSALVRLFSVQGVGLRKQLWWDACCKLSRGETTFAGTGNETRDWLNVADAADLLCLAADHADRDCAVANGGSGEGVKVRDVISQLAAGLGCAEGPQFSGAMRAGDPMHFAADIAEARAWGWAPKIDLAKDIRDYADWFKKGAP